MKGPQPLCSVVLWTNPCEIGNVTKVLMENGFKHIQYLTWYKQSFNMVTSPPCMFLPATEIAVIAFYGNTSHGSQYLNMPTDPLQRHNILIGPKMGKRAVDTEGRDVNVCEKPEYIAEWILRRLTKPGDNVIIGGFGAGGDLRGALNAGCNVFAIEQDLRQFNATKRMMNVFVPQPDLSMVVSRDQLSFGHDCLEMLGTYRNNLDGSTFACPTCGHDWPGVGTTCDRCKYLFCNRCFDDKNTLCFPCRQNRDDDEAKKKEEADKGITAPAIEAVASAISAIEAPGI